MILCRNTFTCNILINIKLLFKTKVYPINPYMKNNIYIYIYLFNAFK